MSKQDSRRSISPSLMRLVKTQVKKAIEQTRETFAHDREQKEKLTKRAYNVLGYAYEAAAHLQHEQVRPTHLFLGLLREEEGIAAIALHHLNVSFSQSHMQVEQLLEPSRNGNSQEIRLSSLVQTILDLAMSEMRRLHHAFLGTEHLLLGLIRCEGEKEIDNLLEGLGITAEQIRSQVFSLLKQQEQTAEQDQAIGSSKVKGNVIMCRLNDDDLAAVDMLVEAGIRTTRSDAASWLIHAGIQANQSSLQKIAGTVAEIQRLREQVQTLVTASPNLASPRSQEASKETAQEEDEG